jgi:RNA polymerase sigma-70 factor, ECF subfamily
MIMNSEQQSYRYDEETLVEMAAKGDLDAFNQLVLSYQDTAFNHAHALLGDSDLAEDAVQDSFIKALQNINSIRSGSFRSWLLKIVTNSAYDILRRSYRHPTQPLFPQDENREELESPAWLADPKASVQETVEQNQFAKDIYKMLDELPEVYRSVITLIDLYELDYSEAAQVLTVPIGTVKSRLARARLQMKKKLQGSFESQSTINIEQENCLVSANATC